MKVLLDVDTGVDDSIALLYALFNPEIEIVGISAVCGNVEAYSPKVSVKSGLFAGAMWASPPTR